MATRFYLPSSGAAAVSPAFDASWEDTAQAGARLKMVPTKISSAFAGITTTKNNIANPWDLLARQYVSDPIAAQTITGTLTAQLRASENFGSADAIAQIVAYVVSNDGLTVRGVLIASTPTAGAAPTNEFATALTNRPFPNTTYRSSTVSSVTAQDGDRLVVEIGTQQNNVTNGTRNSVLEFGDNAASDLPADSTTTTQLNPWVEFSQTITFQSAGVTIAASAIASAEAWGKPTLALRLLAIGTTSGEALGLPKLAIGVKISGIASAGAFGLAQLRLACRSIGIASAETLGLPKLGVALGSRSVASSEALGLPKLLLAQRIIGIGTGEAFGSPRLALTVRAVGVVSAEAFGVPLVAVLVSGGPGVPGAVFLSDIGTFGLALSDETRFGLSLSDLARFGVSLADAEAFRAWVEDEERG